MDETFLHRNTREVIDGKLKEVILPDKHFSANFQGELEIWSS